METQKRIKKECGNYIVEESNDGFKTCKSIGAASTRDFAQKIINTCDGFANAKYAKGRG